MKRILGRKIIPREGVGHEKVDKTLVTEGKSKSAFSMVSLSQLISCTSMRTNAWGSKMETLHDRGKHRTGRSHPALWTRHSLLTTAALQCFALGWRRIWRNWHERISTLRSLGNPRGAFRRLLCLQHIENSHESKSGCTQH